MPVISAKFSPTVVALATRCLPHSFSHCTTVSVSRPTVSVFSNIIRQELIHQLQSITVFITAKDFRLFACILTTWLFINEAQTATSGRHRMASITHKDMDNCSIVDLNAAEMANGGEMGTLVSFQWITTNEALLVTVHIDQELIKLIQTAGTTWADKSKLMLARARGCSYVL